MSNNKTSKTLLNETQIRQFMKLAKLEPLTPGFVDGLEERRESRPSGMAHRGTHGRSDKPIPGTDMMAEEEDPAELEGDIAHDLGDDSLEGDEEALGDEEEIASEEPAEDDGGDRTIQVKDFLAALESALEDVMGEEVEMDTSAMEDEAAVDDAAVDLDADADVDMDVEVEDEEMLQEEEGSKKGEYRRKDKDGKVGHRAGEGKDGHYKDYEGPEGGNKGDDSKTDPGKKDYEKNESIAATDELVEAVTKRVAARILKTALKK